MIIVEGPDGSGKSTLAQSLGASLKWEVYHGGGPPLNLDEVDDRLKHMASRIHDDVIFDRCTVISEQLYGPLYRQVDHIKNKKQLMKYVYACGVVVIYCRPKVLAVPVMRDGEDRAHHLKTIAKQAVTQQAYDDFFSVHPHYRYDFRNSSNMWINYMLSIGETRG